VRLLAFSDLHCDLDQARRLVEMAEEADVVAGVGDFASVHRQLEETIAALAAITVPAILVPGNNETEEALREASSGWDAATVLHGDGATVAGVQFWGLGGGIPITPWDWSFDLSDDEAAGLLADVPEGSVLLVHSPPQGHADRSSAGEHLGSPAIRDAIEARKPSFALCGHIHESWGEESTLGPTRVINLGPEGRLLDV
jgi:uncharacterized protein